jgi:hypothetical protein
MPAALFVLVSSELAGHRPNSNRWPDSCGETGWLVVTTGEGLRFRSAGALHLRSLVRSERSRRWLHWWGLAASHRGYGIGDSSAAPSVIGRVPATNAARSSPCTARRKQVCRCPPGRAPRPAGRRWRQPAPGFGAKYSQRPAWENRAGFRAVVHEGPPPGLMAFAGDVPGRVVPGDA